jgi:hypothetical protein
MLQDTLSHALADCTNSYYVSFLPVPGRGLRFRQCRSGTFSWPCFLRTWPDIYIGTGLEGPAFFPPVLEGHGHGAFSSVCDQNLAFTVRIRDSEIWTVGLVGFRFLLSRLGLACCRPGVIDSPEALAARDVDDAQRAAPAAAVPLCRPQAASLSVSRVTKNSCTSSSDTARGSRSTWPASPSAQAIWPICRSSSFLGKQF